MGKQPLMLRSYGATDVGQRRESNEDAFLQDDELGLWVVADGMGGHAAGEIASHEAIDTIHGMVRRGKQSNELAGPFNEETGQMLISGMGALHLEVLVNRLRSDIALVQTELRQAATAVR